MTTISFYPKFLNENIDAEATIAEYRKWLETHGHYGRLFMWDINKLNAGDPHSIITGVRIFDGEIGMLFRLIFEV
jgi:hypothetical protein